MIELSVFKPAQHEGWVRLRSGRRPYVPAPFDRQRNRRVEVGGVSRATSGLANSISDPQVASRFLHRGSVTATRRGAFSARARDRRLVAAFLHPWASSENHPRPGQFAQQRPLPATVRKCYHHIGFPPPLDENHRPVAVLAWLDMDRS